MPTPSKHGSVALLEQPDSPQWIFGETVIVTRNFIATDYATAVASAPLRGSIGTGDALGLRVRDSQVRRTRGGGGSLTINYENYGQPAQGAQLPADEAEIVNEKIERAIQKHPRYAALGEPILDAINRLLETGVNETRTAALAALEAATVSGDLLPRELYEKLKRGQTHYILYVPVYRISVHSWSAPLILSTGGFLENPPTSPIVPPAGYQWIREGDRMSFNGSTWVVESKWIGAPEWDAEIYGS